MAWTPRRESAAPVFKCDQKPVIFRCGHKTLDFKCGRKTAIFCAALKQPTIELRSVEFTTRFISALSFFTGQPRTA
jgi:hypothetical protein